jgi:nucleotide-binding universal stress UspA family protein
MTGTEQAIVVGVDGSEVAAAALRWAVAEAGYHRRRVDAISVWRYYDEIEDAAPAVVRPNAGMAELAAVIGAQVAAVRAEHPGVVVRHLDLGGRPPGETLVAASRDAAMLVVGNHGITGLLPAVLGSVSAYCVRHALCAVVVVRRDVRHSDATQHATHHATVHSADASVEPTIGPLL